MVVYMFLGAVVSLLSGMKIVQTRRRLQQQKNYKVSFTEALVHTVFDTVDRLSLEWQNVNKIIDQRREQSQYLSIGYYNNSGHRERQPLLALPDSTRTSSQRTTKLEEEIINDPAIQSIPDNRHPHLS
jgi:hypothetical protein